MPEIPLPDRAGHGGEYVIVRTDTLGYTYTAGAPGGGITNVNLSAGTTSNNLSNFVFSNSNGVSFGLNGSTVTASVVAGGNFNLSAGTTSNNLTNAVFSNSNGITFGLNGSTVTASHNALTTHTNPAFSALGGSSTFQTIVFTNSNGISFSNTNGSVWASHNGLTTARASNDGVGLATALTAGPLAWTVNSAGLSLNAGSAAGTTTGFNGANISVSMTHNTAGLNISASVAAPGGGAANIASFWEVNKFVTTAALWNNATYSQRPMFVPFQLEKQINSVNSINVYVSRTGGTSCVATLGFGIYTLANSSSMNLISSTSFNVSMTTSAQFSGIRRLEFTGLGALSLSPGQYYVGLLASIPGTASWGMNIMGIGSAAIAGVIHPGTNSTAATNSQTRLMPMFGVWNATSGALPSAVAASSISGGNGANSPCVYAVIKAIS